MKQFTPNFTKELRDEEILREALTFITRNGKRGFKAYKRLGDAFLAAAVHTVTTQDNGKIKHERFQRATNNEHLADIFDLLDLTIYDQNQPDGIYPNSKNISVHPKGDFIEALLTYSYLRKPRVFGRLIGFIINIADKSIDQKGIHKVTEALNRDFSLGKEEYKNKNHNRKRNNRRNSKSKKRRRKG